MNFKILWYAAHMFIALWNFSHDFYIYLVIELDVILKIFLKIQVTKFITTSLILFS